MALTKAQKEKIIKELTEDLKKIKSLIFVSISGLKVKDLSDLRREIKGVGGKIKIAKKTLMKLSFEKVGLKLPEKLEGEVALVFGFEDEILPIKKIWQFSKSNENLKILSGIFDGNILEKEKMIEIAELPSKKELLAKLIGSISAPVRDFLSVLQGNLKGLIFLLSSIKGQE